MDVCGRMDSDMNVVDEVGGMRLNLHSLKVDMRGIELMLQRASKLIAQLLDTLYPHLDMMMTQQKMKLTHSVFPP